MFTKEHCENCRWFVKFNGVGSALYESVECHPPAGEGTMACFEHYMTKKTAIEKGLILGGVCPVCKRPFEVIDG